MEKLNADMAQALGGLTGRVEELLQSIDGIAASVTELRTKHYELENHLAISDSMLALMLMNHPDPECLQQEWNSFIAHSVAELATTQARLRQIDDDMAEKLSLNRKKVINHWTKVLEIAVGNQK